MAHFHPDAALLTAYAAGSLPEPVRLVVAAHLSSCPDCRAETAAMLRLGGHCVEYSSPMPVSPACRDKVLKKIQLQLDSQDAPEKTQGVPAAACEWPRPLQGYLAHFGETLPWKNRGFGMRTLELPCASKEYECFLMDIEPGRHVPVHSHHGEEMVAVLKGAVVDPSGRFEVGDFIFGDDHIVHEQASDPELGCMCLVVLRGGVAFRGRFGPVLNAIGRVQKLF